MKNCTGNDLGNGKGLMGISSDEENYLIRKWKAFLAWKVAVVYKWILKTTKKNISILGPTTKNS